MTRRLSRAFFRRDPVTVARDLLGQRLVRIIEGRRVTGLIVETEAYLGVPDLAAHTVGGRRTPRNASMWKDGGHAYVYFTYGMHHCINVVAGRAGEPVAVLLRALEPREGLELMAARRPGNRRPADLCSGPARLCEALEIRRELDGADLVTSEILFIERARRAALPPASVRARPRVGVDYAGIWARRLLRFYLAGNAFVSKP